MRTPKLGKNIERILFTEAEIRAGVDRVAGEVTTYFRDDTCTVVSVLKGGCIYTSDLVRRLKLSALVTFLLRKKSRDAVFSW